MKAYLISGVMLAILAALPWAAGAWVAVLAEVAAWAAAACVAAVVTAAAVDMDDDHILKGHLQ